MGSGHYTLRPAPKYVLNGVEGRRLCSPDPRLHPEAQHFWEWYICAPEDYGAAVYWAGELVAFFRFGLWPDDAMLLPSGTWVHPDHRRAGLAKWMWTWAIRKHKPQRVDAHAVSVGGYQLVQSMQRAFPQVVFHTSTNLEDLIE